jgi:hypothetical protein
MNLQGKPSPSTEVKAHLPHAVLIGSGSLRFFGLSIYEARLWAAAEFDPGDYDRQAFALELHYARRLSGLAIAERSIAEMRRGGSFSDSQAGVWLAGLRLAFPDVGAGDRLTGFNDGLGGVRFYFNGAASPPGLASARLDAKAATAPQWVDIEFAKLFFGIWLATTSSVPALRQQLISGAGADQAGAAVAARLAAQRPGDR